MFQAKEKESKKNILVTDFRKIFAGQIPKVELNWRKLQSEVGKNLKVDA